VDRNCIGLGIGLTMPVSLKAYHGLEISYGQAQLESQLRVVEQPDPPYPLQDTNRQFRIIEITDKGRQRRQAWLSQILRCDDWCVYREASAHHLLQAKRAFDIALISGDDEARVKRVIRQMARLVPSKILVAVVTTSTATACTDLLRSGASEILDCGMHAREGVARLRAILRRQNWARTDFAAMLQREAARQFRAQQLCKAPLTPFETRIIAALLAKENRVLRYSELANLSGRQTDERKEFKSVQVTIHHLRRKLTAGVSLLNVRGQGYLLTRDRAPADRPTNQFAEPFDETNSVTKFRD